MAGFVVNSEFEIVSTEKDEIIFHIGDPSLTKKIVDASKHPRVITMQLDGDELAAALWGLENYSKTI
jgi:hypothetical protein